MRLHKVIKAGKLANGAERGKGSIVHAVQSNSEYVLTERALCEASPKISWCDVESEVTCKQCIKKLAIRQGKL